jgi:DNA mismatch repair protein MutS
MKEEKLTPMMQQYHAVKSQYKDHILFFRLGDFYEMFDSDAIIASRELELTLTARADTPMCGVPHHSSQNYIKRLIDKGYKVAICEQTTDPALSKGLVEREVVRVVTPGTVIEDIMLDEGRNNYIACLFVEKKTAGLVFADISTGEMSVLEKTGSKMQSEIIAELSRCAPSEFVFNSEVLSLNEVSHFVKNRLMGCVGELLEEYRFQMNASLLCEQFQTEDIDALSQYPCAYKAVCAVLSYFRETQKSAVKRFVKLDIQGNGAFLSLGLNARRNLELTETMRNKEQKGSLLWVLDKTRTSMGKRRLKQWIEQPLTNIKDILKRLDAVEDFMKNITALGDFCSLLNAVYDLERLMTRIVYKAASPRDVYALGKTCAVLPQLKEALSCFKASYIKELNEKISPLEDIANLVQNAICDNPPMSIKDGGCIRDGFHQELDRLRKISAGGKDLLAELEQREREATGIKNLKVGYNRVFGYYIEVSKGNIPLVPDTYIRKQTLTNGERYLTQELKDIEGEILGANDRILALESEIFTEIREFITAKLNEIQETAQAVSVLDVLSSFANVAIENNYTRPEITLESVIEIHSGRHPVLEKMLSDSVFTPNDTYLDTKENRLIILTGPNMSGKSTYMRQVAIITLMAQMGCFVPAKSARIGVVDKIFTRVGASDDLSSGQSTFMVEMTEVAEILQNATKNSLVILDEIGRGTSTFDGISIAKAVSLHINSKIGCKTLFATHYHELIELEQLQSGIRNFSIAVSKRGDEIRFLHKIVEGGTDDSYGIEVARLAGLPKSVLEQAKQELSQMEETVKAKRISSFLKEQDERTQFDFSTLNEQRIINELRQMDINSISPLEALTTLSDWKKQL